VRLVSVCSLQKFKTIRLHILPVRRTTTGKLPSNLCAPSKLAPHSHAIGQTSRQNQPPILRKTSKQLLWVLTANLACSWERKRTSERDHRAPHASLPGLAAPFQPIRGPVNRPDYFAPPLIGHTRRVLHHHPQLTPRGSSSPVPNTETPLGCVWLQLVIIPLFGFDPRG
jgi:hypothetical protein